MSASRGEAGMGLGRRCSVLSLMALLAASSAPRAEVSAQTEDGSTIVRVVGVIEDPDPISFSLWQQVPHGAAPNSVLNRSGAMRGDGRPDFAFEPATGWPVAVWAFAAGNDHDIALARWAGDRWDPPTFLTVGPADELDPRVAFDASGRVHVVWWTDGVVVHAVSEAGAEGPFDEAVQVSAAGEYARRPSVAIDAGVPLVAYERDGEAGREIVLATPAGDGTRAYQVAATTARTGPLDVVLHSEQGRLWLDWRNSDVELAWSERVNGAWTEPSTLPLEDGSWLGVQAARDAVREALVGP